MLHTHKFALQGCESLRNALLKEPIKIGVYFMWKALHGIQPFGGHPGMATKGCKSSGTSSNATPTTQSVSDSRGDFMIHFRDAHSPQKTSEEVQLSKTALMNPWKSLSVIALLISTVSTQIILHPNASYLQPSAHKLQRHCCIWLKYMCSIMCLALRGFGSSS